MQTYFAIVKSIVVITIFISSHISIKCTISESLHLFICLDSEWEAALDFLPSRLHFIQLHFVSKLSPLRSNVKSVRDANQHKKPVKIWLHCLTNKNNIWLSDISQTWFTKSLFIRVQLYSIFQYLLMYPMRKKCSIIISKIVLYNNNIVEIKMQKWHFCIFTHSLKSWFWE